MTDEVVVEDGEQVVTEPTAEEQARKQGWKPKEEFNGNPEDWVDAQEFIDRGKSWAPILASQKKELQKQLDEMRLLVRQQMQINQKTMQSNRQKFEKDLSLAQGRIAELESLLAKAVSEGNGTAAVQVNREIRNTEAQIQNIRTEMAQPDREIQELGNKWRAVNPWYGNDPEATAFADGLGQFYANQGLTPYEVLQKIEERVRAKFPENFNEDETVNTNKRPAGPDSSSRRSVAKPTKTDDTDTGGMKWSDLSSQEQEVATNVMRKFKMTKADYLKSLSDKI